ncbi:hypothetical protein COUCH_26220 [Couchioplanes caeruleus]|uniref:hypothetical protein n=1 Tax=Couchioplanes caeruleus TaxID=56438 RepID=UPI0020C0C914|nr:hypothetical protein [Couchioplanes caeruleus]UQU62517.1 hypothetical protein COUCH_26220 [Couchioplanes caeruleus]
MNQTEWNTLSDDDARKAKPGARLSNFLQSSDELIVATAALDRLQERMLIELRGGGESIFLRRVGVDEANRLQQLAHQTSAAAERAARDGILRWLWEDRYRTSLRRGSGETWTIEWFYGSPLCLYDGVPFSSANLRDAVRYLIAKNLVEYDDPRDAELSIVPRITDQGIDCVENYDGSVARYVDRKRGSSYETHIHGSVSNSQLAWGDHNEQTIENKGFDAEGVSRLCQAIVEAIPLLNLASGDAEEVESLARLVDNQSRSDQPDQSWMKATLERIAVSLGKASETALGTILQALLKTAAGAVGLPPGTV